MAVGAAPATFIAIIGLALLTSIIMNILVIIIFLRDVKLRTAINLLICNLAVSDVFMATFILPMNLHDITHKDEFHEGEFACRFVNSLPIFCICMSIFSLVAMSMERNRAICRVPATPMDNGQIRWAIAGVWFASLIMVTPTAVEYSVYKYEKTLYIPHSEAEDMGLLLANNTTQGISVVSTNFTEGYVDWYYVSQDVNGSYYEGMGHGCGSQMTHLYGVCNAFFILFCAYIIPLFIICYNYIRIGIFINRQTAVQKEGQVSKRRLKIVKMLILVATLFAICWCPYFVLLCVAKITGVDDMSNTTGAVFLMRIILRTFSVSYNVYVYLAFNTVFRENLRRLVCRCVRPGQIAPAEVDTANREAPATSDRAGRSGASQQAEMANSTATLKTQP